MGGILGGGSKSQSTSTVDKMAAGMRFQTSAFGLAWTLLFGRNRITGNLVDYQDFLAIPHTEVQQQGQGGKGGGGATSSRTSFTYQVALAIGLCAGPLAEDAIKTIWVGKEKKYGTNNAIGSSQPRSALGWGIIGSPAVPNPSPSLFDLMIGSSPQAPWSYMVTYHPDRAIGYHGLAVAIAPQFDLGDNENLANITFEMVGLCPYDQPVSVTDYQVTLPSDTETTEQLMVPDNPGPYTFTVSQGAKWTRDVSVIDNTTDPLLPVTFTKVSGAPGPQEYNVSNVGVYTLNAADKLKILDVTYGYQPNDMSLTVPEYLHFVSHTGVKDNGGAAMTEVASNPAVDQYAQDDAGGYSFSRFNSGEIVKLSYVFNEQLGAVPDEVLSYLWNNLRCGLGQSLIRLDDWTDFRNFCLANNWLISPFLTSQEPLKDVWGRILRITNTDVAWRNGKISLIPRGDTQVTANGVTWTPDLASRYSLGADHFLTDGSGHPVKWKGVTPQDTINHKQVEFLNRENEYNTEPAEYKDEADIEANGLKTDPEILKIHEVTNALFANQVAQNEVNRSLFQPDQYEVTLPWHLIRYDPGDIVDLTDLGLSLDNHLVRIARKTVPPDGCPAYVVQDLGLGSSSPGAAETPQGQGYAPDFNVDPGNVNAPVIFVPPVALMTHEYEVWMAISGGADWGGCNVYLSESGANYKYIGQIRGGARHGVLSAALPASAVTPDTVNTLAVNLTTSRGTLLSGIQADAEGLNTLCKAGDEYLAYKTATLTSQYHYDLAWLVRGAYGTGMSGQLSGADFVRIDDAIFKYACKRTDVGKTVYLKFQSFNQHMRGLQDIDAVDAVTYVVGSATFMPTMTNDFTLDDAFSTILLDASSNDITVTIPTANAYPGLEVTLKRMDAADSAHQVTTAGALIDGGVLWFTIQYESYTIKSDGSAWHVI